MRKIVIFVAGLLLLTTIAYAQTHSLTIGSFTINAGATRTVNSDDLLTVQQGDARYARAVTATPTPTPIATPVPAPVVPQYFGTVTLVNGTASVTLPTITRGCVVSSRSGIDPRYSLSGSTWTFSGAPTDIVDYDCR